LGSTRDRRLTCRHSFHALLVRNGRTVNPLGSARYIGANIDQASGPVIGELTEKRCGKTRTARTCMLAASERAISIRGALACRVAHVVVAIGEDC
jgi:hypothetical protein